VQPETSSARETLKHVFGFDAFRPGQEEIIAAIMAGRDLLAIMPTGAGKSLCYQLPAFIGEGLTVVVSPLIALMDNQIAQMSALGAAVAAIHSGRDRAASVADWRDVAAGKTKLLYLSPERLMSARMLDALATLSVARFVVDEAHCVSQWGHDFRPDYMALTRLKELFPQSAIAAFTATADARTRSEIAERLLRADARSFVHSLDRPNIEISIEPKERSKERLAALVTEQCDGRSDTQGIIYCLSRKQTEEIAGYLSDEGFRTAAYHAGLDARTRTARLNAFLTEPDLIIVATVAFGMGIDKPDIRFVFHHDAPASIESYYQEIGRAGRDGAPARAVLLYGAADIGRRMRMISQNENPGARQAETRRLDELATLCEATSCRHQALLAHFGQTTAPCGACDNCVRPPETVDATEDALRALDAVKSTGAMFGAAHITGVLRGADTAKIRERRHEALPVYGAGAARPAKEWRALLRQMATAGFLAVDPDYGALKFGPKAQELMRGETAFEMRRPPPEAPARQRRARPPAPIVSTANAELLAALKAKRLELAQERNAPAFVIFSDRALADMAARKPLTRDAFGEVFGVGRAKTEAFSDSFIRIIRDFKEDDRPQA